MTEFQRIFEIPTFNSSTKCEENNQKSVSYFYRFLSNPNPKYGDNYQKGQNSRGFLEHQHSISQPKCKTIILPFLIKSPQKTLSCLFFSRSVTFFDALSLRSKFACFNFQGSPSFYNSTLSSCNLSQLFTIVFNFRLPYIKFRHLISY